MSDTGRRHLVRLNRREFLVGAAAIGGLTLAGCSTTDAAGERTIELSRSGPLVIWTWADYIDPPDEAGQGGTVAQFDALSESSVEYVQAWVDSATSWQVIESQVRTGAQPLEVDLVDVPPDSLLDFEAVAPGEGSLTIRPSIMVPTNWLAARLNRLDALEEIPIEAVPNRVNLDPGFLTMDWDRGARFHMPWQSGLTGIAYDPAAVDPSGLPEGDDGLVTTELLFGERYRGRVAMIGEMREAVGLAMLHLRRRSTSGIDFDPTRPTLEAGNAAIDLLVDLQEQGQFTGWFFDDFSAELSEGRADVSMAWSGSVVLLQLDEPDRDFRFVIPGEGAIQWFDTMVIPRGAENVAAAADWMDYVYDPVNAAQITAYLGYISPVLGVQEVLRADPDPEVSAIADDPLIFPDAETKRRLFTWGSMDLDDEASLEDRFNQEFFG